MTNQQKKEWLQQYRNNEKEIDRLTEEIQRWASRSTQMTANLDGMLRSSNVSDKVQISVERIAELQDKLCNAINQCVELRQTIEKVINKVDDSTLERLLKLRYIEGHTWERVAAEMHYSWQHIHKLHSQALHKIRCDRMR